MMERGDPSAPALTVFLDSIRDAVVKARDAYLAAGVPAGAADRHEARAVTTGPRPYSDCGDYFDFGGKWAGYKCRKVVAKRPMSAADWILVLEGAEKGEKPVLKGFISGKGNPFDAMLVPAVSKKWGPGFDFEFPERQKASA